jgi:hypothetical protein
MSHDDDALYAYLYTSENCKVTDIPMFIDQIRNFIRKNGRNINAYMHMEDADKYYNKCLLNIQ